MSNPGQPTAEALRQRDAEFGSQTEALTHFRQVAASRETRLLQLEQEVNELCQRQGEAARYPLEFEPDNTQPSQAASPGVPPSDSPMPLARAMAAAPRGLLSQLREAVPVRHTMEKLSVQLRESEERYRVLFESLDEGFCVIEKVESIAGKPPDFRFVEANAAFAAQSGVSDVVGKTLRQLFKDDSSEWIDTYDAVCTSGKPIRFERKLVSQGRVLELYAFRVEGITPGRVAVNFQDITERKQAEQLLRQNHDTFFNLIQNAPFGVYIVDAQFRLRQVSTASRKVFGNIHPLIGRDFEEVLRLVWTEPFVSDALGHFRRTLRTGEPYAAPNTTQQRQNIADVESYDWKIERILLPDGQFGVVCYFYDITERFQAEEALRQRTAQFETLVNEAPLGVYLIDADFRVRHVNPTALSVFGNIPELIGSDFAEVLHILWPKAKADEAIKQFRHTLETGEACFVPELIEKRADRQTTEYYEWQINRISLPDGRHGVVCYFRDISERVLAQQKIRDSEERYRNLFNSIDEGFCVIDMIFDEHEKPVDFRFLEVNPAFEKQSGIRDATGRRMREIAPDIEAHWSEICGKVAQTGEPVRYVNESKALNDRWFDIYAFRIGGPESRKVAVIFNNIAERKEAEEALRESESRFRALVLASSDLMCRMSPDWSEMRQVYDKHFVVETEVPNRNWLQNYVYRDDQPQLMAAVNEAIQTKSLFEMEHRVRRADGSWGWMLSRAVPLLDAKGDIVEWFGTGSDVTEKKRAEQALCESEERYRNLFNSMDEGFCVLEMIFDDHDKPVDYRFLEVNPAFEKQTGVHDATGKRMREIDPHHDAYWFEIYGKVALTGEPKRFVHEAKALGDRWFDVYAFRLGRPESSRVAILFSDITERIRRERNLGFLVDLQQTLAGLDSCAELLQVASKSIAEYLQLRHCLLTEIDQGAGQATVPHEYLAAGAPELQRVRPLTELRTEVQRQALAAGQTLVSPDVLLEQRGAGELQRLAALGVRSQVSAPYVVDGHWTFLLTAMRGQPCDWPQDEVELITELAARVYVHMERARAQERLVESEERLRLAAEAAHFGMYDRDLHGAYFHVSAQIRQMLDCEPDAPLDHEQVMSHFHPDDQAAGLAELERACDPAGDGQIAVEQRIVRRDGSVRCISSVGRVLFEGGVAKRSIGFWVDITERSRLQRETLEQAQALADLDRRKDEFLAMLSHELRNPLAALSNAVQLLRLQQHEDASLKQCRSIIERQIGQLTHLVDDLLEVSRITTGSVRLRQEQIALSGIVERAVETAQPLIRQHRQRLKVSLPLEPVLLFADAARLEQVLVNLLTNAAKYTDEGGHIWLSVEPEKAAEGVANGTAAAMVVIKVRDTGIGIAPELLPHIFDLFTQADRSLDRSQGGLGIGLCLVQRLVELHGGNVEAHSVLGQGSEFVVRLPLLLTPLPASPTFPLPALDTALAPEKAATGCRVLVVDDNVDAAQSLGLLLEMSGHAVYLAYDGPSALQAAIDYRPDVALLDIGLPGIDGFEVAQRIRHQATLKGMVLVALTGYGQDTDRQRSQDVGFDYHLVKPAAFSEIEKILLRVPERGT